MNALNHTIGHPPIDILSGPFGSQAKAKHKVPTSQLFAEGRDDDIRAILEEQHAATILVTPTWGAAPRGRKPGKNTDEFRRWNTRGAHIAHEVADGRPVVGSLAPILDTSGGDDSVWQGLGTKEQQQQWAHRHHSAQVGTLRQAGVNGFLLEAGRYVEEGRALARLIEEYAGESLIYSVESADGTFPSLQKGKELTYEHALNEILLATRGKIQVGIGINCTSIDACKRAIDETPPGVLTAVYPNKAKLGADAKSARFRELAQRERSQKEEQEYRTLHDELHTSADELRELVRRCIQAKVRIVGVCCGGTPENVRTLRHEADAHALLRAREEVEV